MATKLTGRALSFIRFSKASQAKGGSLERQLEGTEAFCASHNWTLDADLTFRHLGASAFRNASDERGMLYAVVVAIEQGRIRPGDVIVLENLDRYSRDKAHRAFGLLCRILGAGVYVATIKPERLLSEDAIGEIGVIIDVIVDLCRSHGESLRKSDLSRKNWDKKRRNAAEKGIALTSNEVRNGDEQRRDKGQCPGWLTLKDGRYSKHSVRSAIVMGMIQEAENGKGFRAIAKMLNEQKEPCFGHGKTWHPFYVKKILTWNALYGEGQPGAYPNGTDGERKALDIIPNLYPALISQERFQNLQTVLTGRRKVVGHGTGVEYLFGKKLFDAHDGYPMYFAGTKTKKWGYLLNSSAALNGASKGSVTFPYRLVEEAFLDLIHELKPSDLLKQNGHHDEQAQLSAKLQTLDLKLADLSREMDADTEGHAIAFLTKKVRQYSSERAEVLKALDVLRQKTPTVISETLGEMQTLAQMLSKADGNDLIDLRSALRVKIQALVTEVWLLAEKHGESKFAPKTARLQVFFRSGAVCEISLSSVQGKIRIALRSEDITDDLRTWRQQKV